MAVAVHEEVYNKVEKSYEWHVFQCTLAIQIKLGSKLESSAEL